MKFYLAHSTAHDYKKELYGPLRVAFLDEHKIFFPHGTDGQGAKSKEIIPKCDAVLAEVSLPSTGQGIELGWADARNIPIICFYRSDSSPSDALKFICNNMLEYSSSEEMITKLRLEIQKLA